MTRLAPVLRDWLARGQAAVLVTVGAARGSTPREAGARMLVGPAGTAGTIGGGQLEWAAMARARALLQAGGTEAGLDLALGPAIGQCCGGHVVLDLKRADAGVLAALERDEALAAGTLPRVLLFGAGHVGRALAQALAPLPFSVLWLDRRAEAFPAVLPPGIERRHSAEPVAAVAEAPPGAAYLVLTHSHALDFEITEAVLRRADFAYAGLIGSATKRQRFERWFRARGRDPAPLARLTCPIGSGRAHDKRPEVIAALTAAELLAALPAEMG